MNYQISSGFPEVDFNRRILAGDLIRIKHHVSELNEAVVKDLDDYFDMMCELARMDAQVFKNFFHRIARINNMVKKYLGAGKKIEIDGIYSEMFRQVRGRK